MTEIIEYNFGVIMPLLVTALILESRNNFKDWISKDGELPVVVCDVAI